MKTIKITRISVLVILVLLISFSQLLSQTNKEEADKHCDLAWEYFANGLIDKAIEEYKLAIKYKPDDAEAHYNLGLCYSKKGLSDKAIEEFKLAIKYKPDYAEAHFGLGLAYGQKGLTDRKIEEYKLAIKYKPDYVDVHYNLGVLFDEKGLKDKAIEEFKLAVKYKPDDAEAHYGLGVVYGEKGLTDKKIEEYKLAIKYKPDYAEAHYSLGVVYGEQGLAEKAIEEYKLAIKYKPDYAEAHCNLGIVYRRKGLTDKAIEEYKLAIKYKPDLAVVYNNMGIAYYLKGCKTSAADNLYQAGLIYLKQNNREEVLTTIDVMKDFTPDSPLISLLLEKLYAEDIEPIPKDEDVEYTGSGFIINKNGLIVTNYHIIKGMENIDIYFPSKDAQYKAEIVIKDINNDIALLKINDSRFKNNIIAIPFGLGNSSDIKVGQEVYTIGFPMGDILGKSAKLSTGVVNSIMGILDDPTLIQISNPIQPGNSGGALFNSNGDVIGIVIASLNAKYFYENTDIIPQNVNFAIKVDYLRNLISMLPDGEEILKRKSQISNLPLETQFDRIKPFVVNIKAY